VEVRPAADPHASPEAVRRRSDAMRLGNVDVAAGAESRTDGQMDGTKESEARQGRSTKVFAELDSTRPLSFDAVSVSGHVAA
jgi:hypothetical protein